MKAICASPGSWRSRRHHPWRRSGAMEENPMTAKDIMTSDVITLSPAATVKEAANLLTRQQISGAPVLDGRGRIVGILSEADIVTKRGRRVKEIMTQMVCSVAEDTSIEEIATAMT